MTRSAGRHGPLGGSRSRRRWRDSIKVRVLAFLALWMAVIFTAATAFTSLQQARERESLFQARSSLFVQAQADAVMPALWNMDTDVVAQQLKTLERDPDFLGAKVIGSDGEVVGEHGLLSDPESLVLKANIIHENEALGTIELHFTLAGLRASLRADIIQSILLNLFTFIVVITIVYIGLQRILGPMHNMRAAMMSLADGDLTVIIPALAQHDEVGDMAQSIDVFKANAIKMEELREIERRNQEEKDRRSERLEATIHGFDGKVGAMLETVGTATGNLDVTAQTMTASAEQTSRQAEAVVAAAVQALDSVQTVASAAEELTASVHEIGRQVQESSAIALDAVRDAERAGHMVAGLTGAAKQIDQVVGLINSIAVKTNLLALNATIEAARAGVAGRGFGVVAKEVKNLADQTARATQEIVKQVVAVQSATRDTVEVITGIANVINRIDAIAKTIAQGVEQQGLAVQEIARSAGQAATGAQDVTTNIRDVSDAAESSRRSATEVMGATMLVGCELAGLRTEIDTFLGDVRAA